MVPHIDEQEIEVRFKSVTLVLPGSQASAGTMNEDHPVVVLIDEVDFMVKDIAQVEGLEF